MANRSERRSWDKYVAEAKKVRSEILIGDKVLTVYIPSAKQMEKFTETGDVWEQIAALMGDDNAAKIREVAEDAPVTALNALIEDVLGDLGLDGDQGEGAAASS